MGFLSRIFRSNAWITFRSWEYWPFGIVHAPLFPYWLWLSFKSRSLTYFSASNPGILMGGMFGESKFDVMALLPEDAKPKTIRIEFPTTRANVIELLEFHGLTFPIIFKPDLGERGWRVMKIECANDIDRYLAVINMPFLAQAFVPLPLEFGVFYVRYPSEPKGRVTSIVGKEMLSVTGDGRHTFRDLILTKDRAKLQWETLRKRYHERLDHVVPNGETIELVSIGNHCLGTKFLNANHLITDRLSASFDAISKSIEGFYFGRYDLRVASIDDLEAGRVMILELNGCGAEPGHIYQPGFSLVEATRVLLQHWSDIYRVSKENHERGIPYIPFREARAIYKKFKKLVGE